MKHITTVKIPALLGKKLIKNSKLFKWIDDDFVNYGASGKGSKTKKQNLDILEINKDGTFKDIFTNPDEMALSQDQILYFVENNRDDLRQEGYATFFLFKRGKNFFVADVRVGSDGLRVFVSRFESSFVWFADSRHRVVVPQLDTQSIKTSESLMLKPFDPSKLKISYDGKEYKIIKA